MGQAEPYRVHFGVFSWTVGESDPFHSTEVFTDRNTENWLDMVNYCLAIRS